MSNYVDSETIYQQWLDFFGFQDLASKIRTIADDQPGQRSLRVKFNDIYTHDGDLAETLISYPEIALKTGQAALRSFLEPDQEVHINLRIEGLFSKGRERLPIRDLRAENLSKFLSLEGLVKKVTEVRPRLITGVFQCTTCHFKQEMPQDAFQYSEPLECPKDDGGCGKRSGSTTFKLIISECRFIDSQKIEIQEAPEGLKGSEQPQRIAIYFEDDLCGYLFPGDRVTVNGVLKSKQRKEGQTKGTLFDIYMDGNCIESNDQVFVDMDLSEKDIEEAQRMSRDPAIMDNVMKSIAPSIFGYEKIKQALALMIFGGVPKEYADKSKGRGDIHLLLVGDPGTAKSQLLTYMARLAPKGIFTSGKSASAAGLTAAVVKDDFGEGRFTLEAGVMVLADKGLACIDEMDKMTESDRSAMHEAMEQQTISIAKAGIQATLNSRCSVLGAANPKQGRFRIGQPKHEQINLPPPLRSRFDLIFTISDIPNARADRELAETIIKRQRYAEGVLQAKNDDRKLDQLEESMDGTLDSARPAVDMERLKKYIAYSRKTCFPVLTKEASAEIVDFYVNLREKNSQMSGGDEGGAVALTARQLEALVRLAEASARVRLSPEATLQDARTATELMEWSLKDVAMTDSGVYDIDGIIGSGFKNQKDKMYEILTIIREFQTREGRITRTELRQRAEERNISENELENYLKKLQDEGAVYEPRTGEFSIL